MVDPLIKYYEGVKGLIRGRCGDGVVLILSPPLTWADRLVDELVKGFGEDRVRHYIIGSRSGRKEVETLRGILKEIRDSIRRGEGLVIDEKLMNELRDLLGDELVGGVKPDCVIPYYISWEEARRYASDENVDEKVRDALMLITKGFEGKGRRITWFGLDYMPEELVEEVMRAKSEDVEGWINAYLHIVSKLDLDGGVSYEVKNVFKRFIGLIKDSLPVIGQVVHVVPEPSMQMGAVALSFINSLTKDEVHAFREIIDAVTRLKALRSGGDLNTLGKLIAHKLAVDMGIPYEVVHNVLVGFTGLADDVLRDIEERLDIIEIKSQSVEGAFRVYDKGGFESDSEAHPGILIINDELLIQGSVISESISETYRVVTTRGFNDLRNEVLKRLGDGGVVVLVGPRGIGKTTLATYTTWTLFREGGLGFMVNVKNLEEKGTEFTGFIGYYLDNKYDDKYGDLLVVYDPSTTKTYSLADKKTEVPKGMSNTIDTLLRYIAEDEGVRGRVRLLVVLPTDIHQALSQDLKDRLGKYVLDLEEKGFLKDPEFLAEVIREYAKDCSINYGEARALAGEILGRFSEGYTLIARLAGTLIASRYECRVDDVERIIEESRGNAHYFILRYINTLFKVHEDPKTAEALVEIFALRRPFVDKVRPGEPILTPGIVELVGKERGANLLHSAEGGELRGWLARRQHDLIEESIDKLLRCIVSEGEECKELGDALKPWKEAHIPKIRSKTDAVKYFTRKYGKRLIKKLRRHKNCWKRAALIIGAALAEYGSVPRPEDLSKDLLEDAEYLSDALKKCDVDDYLLVDNKIPPLIMNLIKDHACTLTKAFINEYNKAVGEVNKILKIAREIYDAEVFYGLGLVLIIAKAAELGRPIKPSDADAALRVASFAMLFIVLPDYVKSVLRALEPLRDYAPHRYLELQVSSLIHAIDAYTALPLIYSSDRDVVDRVADFLNELGRFSPSLGVIAWAHALAPALKDEYLRELMEKKLGINVVDKANEVLEELGRLKGGVQELMRDEVFMSYIVTRYIRRADEETVKKVILREALILKHELAHYKFKNGELDEAARLLSEAAEEYKEIGDYENYLVARGWALRAEAINGSLVGKELIDEFRQLYEEARRRFKFTARHLSSALNVLSGYLVSLALTGDYETINKLLKRYQRVLNADKQVSVLTRLALSALLNPRGEVNSELKGRLNVNPEELIDAFEYKMYNEFLPALRVAFGTAKPEDVDRVCETIKDSMEKRNCKIALLAAKGDAAVEQLREWLIDTFSERISEEERLNLLKGLGVNVDKLLNMLDEFMELVYGLDGKSLVQLIAPETSTARLALMLRALINGDEMLAKVHALMGAVYATEKPSARLFLEAYRACCDLGSEEFRRVIARLFFYHV